DHVDVALDVMTDMVFAPALTDIDSEREVVLEEIAMVDDNPQDVVHDLAAEAVFGSHPLGRPVIGRAQGISSISRRSLLGYHPGAYIRPNIHLAARLPPAALQRPERRPRRSGQRRAQAHRGGTQAPQGQRSFGTGARPQAR